MIYLVIFHDIERNGDYTYAAFHHLENARKEVQWYREKYLKPALDDFTPKELSDMELTGDFVSEAEYIHLVDTMTVQVERIPLADAL